MEQGSTRARCVKAFEGLNDTRLKHTTLRPFFWGGEGGGVVLCNARVRYWSFLLVKKKQNAVNPSFKPQQQPTIGRLHAKFRGRTGGARTVGAFRTGGEDSSTARHSSSTSIRATSTKSGTTAFVSPVPEGFPPGKYRVYNCVTVGFDWVLSILLLKIDFCWRGGTGLSFRFLSLWGVFFFLPLDLFIFLRKVGYVSSYLLLLVWWCNRCFMRGKEMLMCQVQSAREGSYQVHIVGMQTSMPDS